VIEETTTATAAAATAAAATTAVGMYYLLKARLIQLHLASAQLYPLNVFQIMWLILNNVNFLI